MLFSEMESVKERVTHLKLEHKKLKEFADSTSLEIVNLKSTSSKKLVPVLPTNMSKAFDSLNHSLTTKKLEAYGFGGRSLNLMQSFFDNRLNRLKMCDATIDWIKMKRRCSQGSSFGSLLWNIYQNDMSAHMLKTQM